MYSELVKSVCATLTSIADFFKSVKERQSETFIIKETKSLKKASNITEKMVEIVFKYIDTFEKKDKRHFLRLYKLFKKNN